MVGPGKRAASGPPRRAPAKRRRVARVPRPVKPLTYAVKKKFWLQNWQPNTSTTDGFWRYYAFSISQMPDLASYVAMFDTFRIGAIKVEFHPRFNSFAGDNTTDTVAPGVTNQAGTRMSLLSDSDSQLVPTGAYTSAVYNQYLEQGSPRTYTGNRPFKVYFKPKVKYSVGASDGASRRRAPFLQLADANSQIVQHNGFHAFAWDPNFSGSFGNSFDVLVTFYVMFKGMR